MTDEAAPPVEEPAGVGLDRHHADEAIYQAFNPGPLEMVRGEDGLPAVKPTALPVVAPLNPKTMVCMADKSEYVERNEWGDITERYPEEAVLRAESGAYYVDVDKKHLSLLEHVKKFLGWRILERRLVAPVRPQCQHLVRQMTDFQDAPENQFIERLCTARRDSESFFLSLRDQQIHACELRVPRDPASEARLDRFDAAKVRLGKERSVEGGAFDVDAALRKTEEEAERGLSYGGIFKE